MGTAVISSMERNVWDRVWGQDEVALGLSLGYRNSFELNRRSDRSPIKVISILPTSPCILKQASIHKMRVSFPHNLVPPLFVMCFTKLPKAQPKST